jgi:TRAP-type uncharacterized transport system substrate-binding protein
MIKLDRKLLLIWSLIVVVFVLLVMATIQILGPVPPRVVVMTTGQEGGDYQEFALRYKEVLARSGVNLRLLPSNGSLENFKRLQVAESGVSVGFVQGRLMAGKASPDLVSLGTVFYEPLWIFHRGKPIDRQLKVLRGKRVAIGPPESGTRALVLELLWRNRIDTESAQLLSLSATQAAEALLRGEIDVAFMLSSWESDAVQRLLADERIKLASFPQADAYLTLYPYLTKLTLPAGVADLATLRPATNIVMLGARTSLVVRKDVHPAIQYLLLDAAQNIHSTPGVFQRAGQFPAAEAVDIPLSADALQYYKSGAPFLLRYMPFWLAVLLVRVLVVLIPLIGIIFPLMRLVPFLYGWNVRRRIFRLYGELKFLEAEMEACSKQSDMAELWKRLDQLEYRANHLRVPTMFSNLLYTVRDHIELVRRRQEASPESGRRDLRSSRA